MEIVMAIATLALLAFVTVAFELAAFDHKNRPAWLGGEEPAPCAGEQVEIR